MSGAQQRTSRSRSKTAPEHGGPTVTSRGETNEVLPTQARSTTGAVEVGDDRSSSLSDLGESLEDRDEAALRTQGSPGVEENDSEAETERLENTPRKLTRTATDLTIRSVMTTDPENHNTTSTRRAGTDLSDKSADTTTNEAEHADGETSPRKRKRSSSALSSLGDDVDAEQPDRKRSRSPRNSVLNGEDAMVDVPEHAIEDDDDHVAKDVDGQAEDGNGEEQPAFAPEAKKGKKAEVNENAGDMPEDEEHAEGEMDLDDIGAMEEDRERKQNALENLNKIEKQFLAFQKKRLDEQLERLSSEYEQLRQPTSDHPEYLLMLQAVDARRDEKIRQENVRLKLKTQILNQQHVATRGSILSQWKHEIGEIRMNTLSECNRRITHLQKDRRFWGAHETDHTIKFNPKRSEQIKNQSAYNLEVSVLAGVAKHVGFPAAPDLSGARTNELEQDLASMGISSRPAPFVRPLNEASRADRAAAEELFFEQTPWANPQHPAHQNTHYHAMAAPQQQRVTSNPFATPASQKDRPVGEHATNGSASTIDMQSNPPSHGPTSAQHQDLYESPIMQLKQNLARTEPVGTTSAHHAPRGVWGNSAFGAASLTHLTAGSAPPGAEGATPMKAEDAAEQLQRASMPQRTGVPVGGSGLFR
ncbi:hypothetical protein K490DRAFT_73112 [Saccharata proteae CBS 121410]|uniref:Transcriptional regulatory protein DEP1 n=1 Tax=Saccharata proteae CBS 121410 TaxID=1314787 RepID=A0A9P4HXC9_9PEZI|nr:hypothetical protein K490DRAFT_73112 [Saccharata proteae CBS 121410]